jgi:hypothetical protein
MLEELGWLELLPLIGLAADFVLILQTSNVE